MSNEITDIFAEQRNKYEIEQRFEKALQERYGIEMLEKIQVAADNADVDVSEFMINCAREFLDSKFMTQCIRDKEIKDKGFTCKNCGHGWMHKGNSKYIVCPKCRFNNINIRIDPVIDSEDLELRGMERKTCQHCNHTWIIYKNSGLGIICNKCGHILGSDCSNCKHVEGK